MARGDRVVATCEGCGETFRCLEGSAAHSEKLCTPCATERDKTPQWGA